MLNGTWPQICQIKICQFPKFSNLPNLTPSKISHYIVFIYLFIFGMEYALTETITWHYNS